MNIDEATALLGLQGMDVKAVAAIVAVPAVKSAWAAAVRNAHPDSSTVVSPDAAGVIKKLTEARKTLLDAIAGADSACKLCNGTGMVRARLGSRTCAACDGTGDRL